MSSHNRSNSEHRHRDRNSNYSAAPHSHARDHRDHRDRYTASFSSSSSSASPDNATLALRLPVPRSSDPTPPGPAPAVQQPTEIAHFSYDAHGQFHADRSSLRYWSPPPSSLLPCTRVSDPRELAVPLAAVPGCVRDDDKRFVDLNSGFDQYDPNAGPGIEPLDNLLRGLVEHGVWSAQGGGADGVSIVTWRGVMTKLLVAPYNDRDGWELGFVKHKSTVFIHEHITPDRLAQEADTQRDPRRARMAYWGYRFEHLCVLPTAPASLSSADLHQAHELRTSSPLNPKIQYCSVVKTKIGHHRVLLGAEVDCCLPAAPRPTPTSTPAANANAPAPPLHYIELKTHRLGTGGVFGWRAKLLRIWAQSFLAGIPTIMVGFRDDAGIVRAVREYKTLELPRGVRGVDAAQGGWDPNVCIRFAADAIDRIVSVVRGGEEGVEWMARYVPRERVVEVFRKTGGEEVGGEKGGKAWANGREGGVVPDWFKRGEGFEQRPL